MDKSFKRDQLRKKLMKKTQDKMSEKFAGVEVHIIKAVKLIDDLENISNLLSENIDDWSKRSPSGVAEEKFNELKDNKELIDKQKDSLSEFIDSEMNKELPRFSNLAGTILGARLLAEAGSKKKLAMIPSSTMQVLGAEKALFNHIKKKTLPPKHGHIFNHPLIQRMPKNKRGKASRILAGKLSIAARMDFFESKDDLDLRKEVEDAVKNL
jgi:nucleolar protein 56